MQIKRLIQDISTQESCMQADIEANALLSQGWELSGDNIKLGIGKQLLVFTKDRVKPKKEMSLSDLVKVLGLLDQFRNSED